MMEPFVIRQITAGKPDLIAASSGDSWDPTQGPDGRYYAASNDTAGFHGGDRNNVNFNVVEADGLSGATVNRMPEYGKQGEEKEDGRTWKTSGCYCVDGVLYLVAGRHCYGDESGDVRKRQTVINASILKSADFGKTWTRSESENYHDPMFPSDFCTPYFIHYGQDGAAPDVDNAQQYIYAVSNNGFWDSGDYYVLGRVLRDRLGDLNPRDWSFYTGGDGMQEENWTSDAAKAAHIIDAPFHCGEAGPTYIPAIGQYLMAAWYYTGNGRDDTEETWFDYYTAPHPWGPWRLADKQKNNPEGWYCPRILTTGQERTGNTLRLKLVTGGDWKNLNIYKYVTIPLTLTGE